MNQLARQRQMIELYRTKRDQAKAERLIEMYRKITAQARGRADDEAAEIQR